jgi:hypothetical protein
MTAGLPGVGIGGIFYLASALLMPVRSAIATLQGRGHEARWALALRQSGLAAIILGAIWATGWLIGWSIGIISPDAAPTFANGVTTQREVHNVMRTAALLLSFGTLAAVLAVVQVLRIALPSARADANATGRPDHSSRSAA